MVKQISFVWLAGQCKIVAEPVCGVPTRQNACRTRLYCLAFWRAAASVLGFRARSCISLLGAVLALLLPSVVASAPPPAPQEIGVVTILEGKAWLTRGTSVYALAEGTRLEAGDILNTIERTYLQIEGEGRPTLSVGPQAQLLVPAGADATVSLILTKGWLKVTLPKNAKPYAVVVGPRTYNPAPGGALVLNAADPVEVFVETGALKASAPGRSGPDSTVGSGQYVMARGAEPLRTEARPTQAFLAALPIPFRDRPPELLARYKEKRVAPKRDRDVEFAEVDQWLRIVPSWRRELLRRFQPRLKDTAFRQGVESRIKDYPEWDRILHPEKYEPKPPVPAPASAAPAEVSKQAPARW